MSDTTDLSISPSLAKRYVGNPARANKARLSKLKASLESLKSELIAWETNFRPSYMADVVQETLNWHSLRNDIRDKQAEIGLIQDLLKIEGRDARARFVRPFAFPENV